MFILFLIYSGLFSGYVFTVLVDIYCYASDVSYVAVNTESETLINLCTN